MREVARALQENTREGNIVCRYSGETVKGIVQSADKALYEAKGAGRDRLVVAVERAALRKVRNLLDKVGAEEADGRRMRRFAYLAGGVLLLLLIFFVASLLI